MRLITPPPGYSPVPDGTRSRTEPGPGAAAAAAAPQTPRLSHKKSFRLSTPREPQFASPPRYPADRALTTSAEGAAIQSILWMMTDSALVAKIAFDFFLRLDKKRVELAAAEGKVKDAAGAPDALQFVQDFVKAAFVRSKRRTGSDASDSLWMEFDEKYHAALLALQEEGSARPELLTTAAAAAAAYASDADGSELSVVDSDPGVVFRDGALPSVISDALSGDERSELAEVRERQHALALFVHEYMPVMRQVIAWLSVSSRGSVVEGIVREQLIQACADEEQGLAVVRAQQPWLEVIFGDTLVAETPRAAAATEVDATVTVVDRQQQLLQRLRFTVARGVDYQAHRDWLRQPCKKYVASLAYQAHVDEVVDAAMDAALAAGKDEAAAAEAARADIDPNDFMPGAVTDTQLREYVRKLRYQWQSQLFRGVPRRWSQALEVCVDFPFESKVPGASLRDHPERQVALTSATIERVARLICQFLFTGRQSLLEEAAEVQAGDRLEAKPMMPPQSRPRSDRPARRARAGNTCGTLFCTPLPVSILLTVATAGLCIAALVEHWGAISSLEDQYGSEPVSIVMAAGVPALVGIISFLFLHAIQACCGQRAQSAVGPATSLTTGRPVRRHSCCC